MKTGTLTQPRSLCIEWLWRTACGVLSLIYLMASPGAMAQNLNVLVSNETAPPGATVQIKFTLSQPAAVSSGELAVTLDPTVFGGITGIAAFSAAGDAAGYASVNGNRVDLHFASQSASMGSAGGMPLVVIAVPILATAKAGAQGAITTDPTGSAWNGAQGSPAYAVSVTRGGVTVGGTLSVSQVTPVSNLPVGTVVHVMGTGFTSGTVVSISAASIASEQVLGPQEVDVTLAGPTDLGGKQVTVTNKDGTVVNFFGAPTASPLAILGGTTLDAVFDGVIPLLPTASYTGGSSGPTLDTTAGRIVLANPGSTPIDVSVELVNPGGEDTKQLTIALPAGGQYDSGVFSLEAGALDGIQVLATGPLRMLQLLANYNSVKQTTTYVLAPFNPIGIRPLALSVNTAPIQFSYYWVTGGPAPQPQSIPVYPQPPGPDDIGFTVSFSTSFGGNWLSVTPSSGTTCGVPVDCAAAPTVTVTANPTGLPVGTYEGVLTITPLATRFQPAGPPVQIAVGLTVTNTPIVNQIVRGAEFYSAIPSIKFPITADQLAGPFTVGVLTNSGGNWLSATPMSGTTPAQITVTAAPGSLGPGVYTGLVTVQGGNGGVFAIPSTLTVFGGPDCTLLRPNPSAPFAMGPGEAPPAPQTILVAVYGSANCPLHVPFTATVATHSGGNWLTASPAVDASSVTISVNPAGLRPGIYTGVVTLTSSQTARAQIPVALNIWMGPTPALVAWPPAITVWAQPFTPQPLLGGVEIFAGDEQAELSVRTTTASGGNWLSATAPYPTPGSIELSFDASHLAAGVYHGDAIVSVPAQNLDVPVTLTVAPPTVSPDIAPPVLGSVLNAASGVEGAIAPGEIISLRGFGFSGPVVTGGGGVLARPRVTSTVPTGAGGVQVLINGQPAPLLYEGSSQVNAIVPYEVAGQAAATVQLVDVAPSAVWSFPVAPAAPGIFTLNSAGAGQAAVLNQDNSVNGPNQPAAGGTVIQIFATGIPVQGAVTGTVTPSPVFNATPPVSVLIAGMSANVTYAGPAPGQVAGLVQVNAVVPEDAPTSAAVPILLKAAGQQSQTVATIAIQ